MLEPYHLVQVVSTAHAVEMPIRAPAVSDAGSGTRYPPAPQASVSPTASTSCGEDGAAAISPLVLCLADEGIA